MLYVFVPMGIVYLFLLIAVFSFIGEIINNVGNALNELGALISSSTEQSAASVQDFLSYAFAKIDWNGNLFATIRQIADTHWIGETLKGFFATLNQSTEGFEEQLAAIVAAFKDKLIADVVATAVICLLGIIAANYATRFVMRSRMARRNIRQIAIAHALVPLAQSLTLVAGLALWVFLKWYSVPIYVGLAFAWSALSLCISFVVYRNGQVKVKQIVTGKNVMLHVATTAIVLALNAAVAVILYFVNPLLDLLIILPLVIYSTNACDVNTDLFVSEQIALLSPAPQSDFDAKPVDVTDSLC